MMTDLKSARLLQMLLIGLVSVGLLTMAMPRLLASVRYLPVELAIESYYADRVIPTHRMHTLIGFADEAISLHDHYRYRDGLSFLYYLRGVDIYTPALERRDQYIQAEQTAIEVVARAPLQPETWFRIATVRSILNEEPEDVLGSWRMSVFTGRTHSTLMVPRVGVALRYLPQMDSETRGMLRDQVVLGWQLKPNELAGLLSEFDPDLTAMRELLANSAPSQLREMEARFEKTP